VSFDPTHSNESRINSWLRKRFPERLIYIRTEGSSRTLKLTTYRQVFLATAMTLAMGWTVYTTGMQYAHEMILASKKEQVELAENSRDTVLAEVVSYRSKVDEITANLKSSYTAAAKYTIQQSEIKDKINALENKLKTSNLSSASKRKIRKQIEASQKKLSRIKIAAESVENKRSLLANELSEVGARLRKITLNSDVDEDLMELHNAILQRDFAISERDTLVAQNKKLSNRLLQIQDAQKEIFDQVSSLSENGISEIEKTLKKTGLNVDKLLTEKQSSRGGPFIPAKFPDLGRDDLNAAMEGLSNKIARWDRLAGLMETLPLGYPIDKPRITSGFGYRRDPFTGTLALHSGIDFRGKKGDIAHATAPGIVKYARMRGNYGIVVDVDHGMGFVTRYAHLDKALVKVGDEVVVGSDLGLVGNTGRSTGRHLHYEVRYNNVPRNPKELIRVKRYVQKTK